MAMRKLGFAALLCSLTGCGLFSAPTPPPTGEALQSIADRLPPGQRMLIPVETTDDDGNPVVIATRVCRPPDPAPARVVIINHASMPTEKGRAAMVAMACDSEPVRWFRDRGFLVMIPLRRGYGSVGGDWGEYAGSCASPDYAHAGLEAARDIAAAVTFAASLPYAQDRGVVVIGEDAGGWATMAYDATAHPQVSALISVAGGRGARTGDAAHLCRPDRLVDAAGTLGRHAATPMLWLYSRNDSVFADEIVTAMHTAFIQSGGRASLHMLDAFGDDGHALFTAEGGSAVWGPVVEQYLAEHAP